MKNILIIDDDMDILILLKKIFERNNYKVTILKEIEEFDKKYFECFDLILLDIIMVNIDGYYICEKIRAISNIPILFLTAKNMEEDIIKGFKIGADDYITKPFSIPQLLARVEANIKRTIRYNSEKNNIVMIGRLTFLFNEKRIEVDNKPLQLTPNEYYICELLASNFNRVFTKEEIYETIYNLDSDTLINSIHEYIYQIRKKFKIYNINPIKTIWGIGYKWES